MVKVILVGLFLSTCAASCRTNGSTTDSPAPIVKDASFCSPAEKHLSDMCKADPIGNKECCDIVRITPKQHSFTDVCANVMNGGIFINPQCISQVKKCADVNTVCLQQN